MPNRHDPNSSVLDVVEESVRRNDHHTKRQVGEFRQNASGIGKAAEALQSFFRTRSEASSRGGIIAPDVCNGRKELSTT
jgi:hypothetical protein